ncbi:MAG: biotin--[acetyl-CoA-carboxylase] ligase [Coriobacteriia bacterium]|nr:biotin--[acetyl-CoA-carboxylase] ligase [Coriobacteriia bacterium]
MKTKEKVLALLEDKRGQSVSGEHIASHLELSRNTVWKAIKELRGEGYRIAAVTNKGYCLDRNNDILAVQGITPYLRHEELSGRISVYDSIESTNTIAKEIAMAGAPHGTAVLANAQTAGKGRYGRTFISPPGSGLYMSLVLCPKQISFATPTLITASTAVSVCEAIEAVSEIKPSIKWANDIFVDSKKVCGISTEAAMDFESGTMQWIVVGIGINFIQPEKGFPQDARNTIGSLFEEGSPSSNRNQLAAEIINRVASPEKLYDDAEMLARYKQRMFILGEKVSVIRANDQYEAIALDLDEKGQLIVKAETGEMLTLSSGEVSVRPK